MALGCINWRRKHRIEADVSLLDHQHHGHERVVSLSVNGYVDEDHDEKILNTKIGIAKRLTWDELLTYQHGKFSNAYSVKDYNGKRSFLSYKNQLNILLSLQHDHIVKLLGYWDDDDDDKEEGVLVFEHPTNGNLWQRLFNIGEISTRSTESCVLSWKHRMKILHQLAQAIEYLHEKRPEQIIHGNITPSNVLLDELFNCKLSGFGSAKVGIQDGSSAMKGPFVLDHPGYTDFHLLSTGMALKEHDIFSYGVIVLELITGIAGPCLHFGGTVESVVKTISNGDDAMLMGMIDKSLKVDLKLKEVKAMAAIAAMCLNTSLDLRPSASDIVKTLGIEFRQQ